LGEPEGLYPEVISRDQISTVDNCLNSISSQTNGYYTESKIRIELGGSRRRGSRLYKVGSGYISEVYNINK
jgi:hypothetical protein